LDLKPYFSTFLRTLKAYNKREKVLSNILLAGIVVLIFKFIFLAGPSIYTEGYVGRISMLNPVFGDMNEVDRDVSKLIFSGLTRYDLKTRSILPDLATFKVSEDKKTYTFSLKEHVKWHDGHELDADDVYFTFHKIIQDETFPNPVLKANFTGVEIKKVDEKTLEFSLEKPNSFFIANTTVGILPEHILGDVTVAELMVHDFNSAPVGTGPYKVNGKFKTYSNGQTSVILERFRDYYAERSEVSQVKILTYPYVEHMVDDRSNLTAVSRLTGADADDVRKDSDFEMVPYKLPQYTAVFMNMDSGVLKNNKLRLGVAKSVNKGDLLNVLKDIELVDTPLLELDAENWIYESDEEQANGALYDAGFRYRDDEDKYRKDSDGNVLEFDFVARQYTEGSRLYQNAHDLVAFLVKSWDEVGIKVNVKWLDLVGYNEAIVDRDYDLLLAGESLGYNLDTFAYWHSSQVGDEGLNLSDYKSFKVDTLLEDIRYTFDKDEKQEKLAELATVMANDVPALFLYRPVYYFVTSSFVTGVDVDGMAYPGDKYLQISGWKE
jgi:peptide/nickel transport system substrate-binding protein